MDRLKLILLPIVICLASNSFAALRYVDNAATGANNGTSWANAWTSLGAITGVGAGDTVYVSGGTTSKTYNMGAFNPPSGNSGAQFTVAIGPDAGHTGTAIFNNNAGAAKFIGNNPNYFTLNGRLSGTNHFRVQGYFHVVNTTAQTTRVKILGLNTNGLMWFYDSSLGLPSIQTEIGWINWDLVNDTGFAAKVVWVGKGDYASGYGANSIHDCDVPIYYHTPPDGVANDGFKDFSCTDVYNCRIYGVPTSAVTAGDHQDGVQTDGGFLRFWNNHFKNMTNYNLFLNYFGNNTPDIRIYNNVFEYSDPLLVGGYNVNVAIGGNAIGTWFHRRVDVMNNTFVGGFGSLDMDNEGMIANYTDCHVMNNLFYNSPTPDYGPQASQPITSNNYVGTAGISFVNAAAGDFHLQSGSTAAIGQGTATFPSTIFTTDKDGNTRTVPWDIGAYEFASGGADTTPPVLQNVTVAANGTTWIFTFNENVRTAGAGWTTSMSGGALTLSGFSASGLTITATGSRTIGAEETGTISYVQPGNGVEDNPAGNDLVSVTGVVVSNGSTQGRAETPVITPLGGPYFGTQSIAITDASPSPTIYYTTDGSSPTTGSTVYSGPFNISVGTAVRAIATSSGLATSLTASSNYEIATWVTPIGLKTMSMPQITGPFTANFRAKVSTLDANAVVGFGPIATTRHEDLAVIVRFSPFGNVIDVRNGANYNAANTVTFALDTFYDFVVQGNVLTKKVTSVTVTPAAGGATTELTNGNYDFRDSQATATDLDWIGFIVVGSANMTVTNMSFTGGGSTAPSYSDKAPTLIILSE